MIISTELSVTGNKTQTKNADCFIRQKSKVLIYQNNSLPVYNFTEMHTQTFWQTINKLFRL